MRNDGYCESVRLGSWHVDIQWRRSLGGQAFVTGFMAIHDDRRTSVCRSFADGACSTTGDAEGLGWTSTGLLDELLSELKRWEMVVLPRVASETARPVLVPDDCTNNDALEADFNDPA